MDLDLSADQRSFRSTTKDFLDRRMPLATVREVSEKDEGFPRTWWQQGAELGWTAMLVPEELGGGSISGDGLADLAIIAEEMGRLVSPGPLLGTSAVVTGLVAAGEQHLTTLEEIVAGESVASWAVYEPGRAWDPVRPGLRATRTSSGWVLDGVKDRVESGDQADLLLVTAVCDEGPAQFLVRTDSPGVAVVRQWSLDLTRRYAEVRFAQVEVGEDAIVGSPGSAAEVIERQADVVVALQSAESAGAVDRVLEFTLQWAFDRYTFGRPIASYQALKHRFADNKAWLEACHAISLAAAKELSAGLPDARQTVSSAKSFVGEKAPQIVQDCVQLHGGIGVTWEHDLHLYLRRVTVNRALYGTPEDHRRRIADLMDV